MKYPPKPQDLLRYCFLLAGTWFTSGCQSPTPWEDKLATHLRAKNQQSLLASPWRAQNIAAGAAILTATIFDSAKVKATITHSKPLAEKSSKVSSNIVFASEGGGIGSAVPITPDGYFLTAGHCVESGKISLVALNRKTHRLELHPARRVFTANGRGHKADLAIVHADIPSTALRPASPDTIHTQATVAAVGRASVFLEHKFDLVTVGQISKISPLLKDSSGLKYYSISHDVPIYTGDSGGPLLTNDYTVAGIQSSGSIGGFIGGWLLFPNSTPLFTWVRNISFLPDATWLNETIDKDRARQPARIPKR